MLFNSGVFLKFFAAFLLLYWLVRGSLKARNALIVVASYIFYGWWSPSENPAANAASQVGSAVLSFLWHCRFLALLVATSLFDFAIGLGLERLTQTSHRKLLVSASVAANLGVLGFFKYFNFFADSLTSGLRAIGIPAEAASLSIVLPVGISFYTFQSMSYTLDVYRRHIRATRSVADFLAFVSFFPQLVAGPIERAAHLLPQFHRTVTINAQMLEEGVWLIVWGMFKKVVLADNLAPLVEMVYDGGNYGCAAVAAGTVAFALQIYCDFSGYSDIARGTARVLGFDIMWNFNIPYAATNVREFWRRWHISLSTWLRDYLYVSLGGNRLGTLRTYANLLITMLLGGLWHGAAWHFILWGAWHGIGLAVQRSPVNRFRLFGDNSYFRHVGAWIGTMAFVLYGWLLFRASSLEQIAAMTRSLADFSAPAWMGSYLVNLLVFATPLAAMEIWQTRRRDLLAPLKLPRWGKAALQGALIWGILIYWQQDKTTFIYFQF